MIRHITCSKLKPEAQHEKQAVADSIKSLKEHIPEIVTLEVYVDNVQLSKFGKSYDVLMDSTFNNIEDLKVYLSHPYHMEVVHPFVIERLLDYVMVDFDI